MQYPCLISVGWIKEVAVVNLAKQHNSNFIKHEVKCIENLSGTFGDNKMCFGFPCLKLNKDILQVRPHSVSFGSTRLYASLLF